MGVIKISSVMAEISLCQSKNCTKIDNTCFDERGFLFQFTSIIAHWNCVYWYNGTWNFMKTDFTACDGLKWSEVPCRIYIVKVAKNVFSVHCSPVRRLSFSSCHMRTGVMTMLAIFCYLNTANLRSSSDSTANLSFMFLCIRLMDLRNLLILNGLVSVMCTVLYWTVLNCTIPASRYVMISVMYGNFDIAWVPAPSQIQGGRNNANNNNHCYCNNYHNDTAKPTKICTLWTTNKKV